MKQLFRCLAAVTVASVAIAVPVHAQTASDFAIKSGDRVVFYGDSITDQRMYSLMTEQYIVTRFPGLNVRFVHSGWGGDRVTGGGGGPIDLRLDRDVTSYKPTVVTVMLGMNDASYRPFDANIFKTYADGYKHLVSKLKTDNPGVRLTLIKASPFDDITRPVSFPGGYKAVLLR
jgi:lysophospholipase L1-like esterase